MNLTDTFWGVAFGVSLVFGICFVILFIAYKVLYHRVNKILRRWIMISQILMIFTLISIWISLAWGLVILFFGCSFLV